MGAENTSNCTACDSSDFKYNDRIKPLIAEWCVGCHNSASAGGGYDFTDYAGVSAAVANGRLSGAVNHQSGFISMPQNGPKLNACDINSINKWISNGYPDN